MEVTHPAIQTLASNLEAFAGRWFRRTVANPLLVITGLPGCGKTHTLEKLATFARAAAVPAWEQRKWRAGPPSIAFLRWPEMMVSISEGYELMVQDACDAGLLLLDDIGAENDPWKKGADRLCQILSRREEKFSIITTNVESSAWAKVFDRRIADRLCRQSVIVDLHEVPSYATTNPPPTPDDL